MVEHGSKSKFINDAYTRRRVPGKGMCGMKKKSGKSSDMRMISASFDTETFQEIRQRALDQGTSLSEQIRILVEWGLEANDDT